MSFEVFLHVLGPGIPDEELRGIFAGEAAPAPDSSDQWVLGECRIHLTRDDAGDVSVLVVDRPTGDPMLWNGLFKILHRGDAVFFFPRDPLVPIVADAKAVDMMPEDMRESFGDAHVVSSVQELMDSLDI